MFREITITKPSEGGPKRRWYQSDYFDLYIFYIRHSERMDKFADREFVGMQLCYDIRRNQRTLEWKKSDGYAHHAVKKGGGDTMSDHGSSAALLQKGGTFDSAKVLDKFMQDAPGLPGQIRNFVLQRLAEYAKLNPPVPPSAEELAAAAAAANVAEQIAAQIEAEAEMLRGEQAAAQVALSAPPTPPKSPITPSQVAPQRVTVSTPSAAMLAATTTNVKAPIGGLAAIAAKAQAEATAAAEAAELAAVQAAKQIAKQAVTRTVIPVPGQAQDPAATVSGAVTPASPAGVSKTLYTNTDLESFSLDGLLKP